MQKIKSHNFFIKIRRFVQNRHASFGLNLALILLILAFKGANGEGQGPFFISFVDKYIEEQATSLPNLVKSQYQLADLNSLFATVSAQIPGSGGAQEDKESTLEISSIQQNSFMAYSPSDDNYLDDLSGKRSNIVEYVVQEGDNLSFIASDYGVSADSIRWANNLRGDSLTIGQILKIPPVSGVIHKIKKGDTIQTIAKKYGVEYGKIIQFNRLPQDGRLALGDEIVVPDGAVKAVSPVKSGNIASRFAHLPGLSEFFDYILPASGFNWGKIHGRNGVDVANSCGTPIYALADGAVTAAKETGWNGGFGKYLKISHPKGIESLYAHMSKIKVSQGEPVVKGQAIGLMGSTGRSTGCHLHLEVHGAQNPFTK